MSRMVVSTQEIDFLFENRCNLQNFHYYTNDESVYEYFCAKVAEVFGLKEDPRTASNISKEELDSLNKKYGLSLQTAYLNGPKCVCGRRLNGYDFVLNAIFRHGVKFIRDHKISGDAKFILPFRRAIDSLCCSNCGELLPLAAGSWYKDSSSIDKYGPCCSADVASPVMS